MSDVLIRGVPSDDLDVIRAAAKAEGVSLQGYLLRALNDQAAHVRRQQGLARAAARLHGRQPVPSEERAAVRDSVERGGEERASDLGDRRG